MFYIAREYAVYLHRDQRYGEEPYEVHLDETVAVLREFGYYDHDDIIAGYLHDTVEDCNVSLADIEARFGTTVTRIVNAATGIGPNRKARVAMVLSNLRAYPRAAPVKTADRIVNMRNARGTKLGIMYARELPEFLEVIEGSVSSEMFNSLKDLGNEPDTLG